MQSPRKLFQIVTETDGGFSSREVPIPADSPRNPGRSPESAANRAESPGNRPPRRRGGGPAVGLGGESGERARRRRERGCGEEGGVVVFGLGERRGEPTE